MFIMYLVFNNILILFYFMLCFENSIELFTNYEMTPKLEDVKNSKKKKFTKCYKSRFSNTPKNSLNVATRVER